MRVRTPTSRESMRRFIRTVDLLSAFLAAPIAIGLRDPSMFSGERLTPTVGYCVIGFGTALLMVIAFDLGRSVGHVSMREARFIVAASVAATALNAVCAFSVDRLDYVPRSLPLIQSLVLCALILGGRTVAASRSSADAQVRNHLVEPQTLLVSANDLALSYLKMLDAFSVDRAHIVAILDGNPKFFGRALLGHPIIGPPSAIMRVVNEYAVHGVDIARVLICQNRPSKADQIWAKIEEYCHLANIELKYLSDVLGVKLGGTIELGETIETENDDQEPQEPEVRSKGYRFVKRVLDLSLAVMLAIAISPVIILVSLGVIIDLRWPIIFWQKRTGYRGGAFLIFKFRTLHAPYDRHGDFVEEVRRTSRFGSFLRRTRLDELPQLWNIVCGEMSFVGPRPLLPIDQPTGKTLRLRMRPGITGWAQINGGKQITAEEKGLLDEWYVRRASLWLDLRIIMGTLRIVLFGDQRHFSRQVESLETNNSIKSARSRWLRLGARSSPQQGLAIDGP